MLYYLFILIAWFVLIYFAGFIATLPIRKKFNPNIYELILRNCSIGYVIIIIIQSVYSTSFRTVNVIFLLIIVLALYEISRNKTSYKSDIRFNIHHLIFVISGCILFFCYSWLVSTDDDGFVLHAGNYDYVLYAKISKYISSSGFENQFNILNEMDPYYNWVAPYHYFDLWGAAAVSNLTGIDNYASLRLIIYPTFYLLYFVGLLAIINNSDWKSTLVVLSFMMIGGISFGFDGEINFLKNLDNISFNIFDPEYAKLSYFYFFFIGAYLLYYHRHYALSCLCLLSLTVAHIIALPTTVFSLLFIIIFSNFSKAISLSDRLKCMLYVMSVTFAFLIFYALINDGRVSGAGSHSPLKFISDSLQLINLQTQRNIILATILGTIIIYMPFLYSIFLLRKRIIISNNKIPIAFIILEFIISLLIWCVLYAEMNSRQIHQDLSLPALNATFTILMINLYRNYKVNLNSLPWYKLASPVLILFIIIHNYISNFKSMTARKARPYSREYLSEVRKNLEGGTIIATLKGKKQMAEIGDKYNIIYPLGDYLFMMNKNNYTVNVGDLDTHPDTSTLLNKYRSEKAIKDGLFLRFSRKPENIHMNRNDLLLSFLKKYNIKQMIIGKDADIPDVLIPFIHQEINDIISNERFISFGSFNQKTQGF